MEFSVFHLGLVMLGGALGGVARVLLNETVTRLLGSDFPWGTLVVNVSGALLIGGLAAIAMVGNTLLPPTAWAFFAIGVLGSYTTVSSFSLQTLTLLQRGARGTALANVLLSVCLCVGAAALGFAVGALLFFGTPA